MQWRRMVARGFDSAVVGELNEVVYGVAAYFLICV